MKYVFLNEINLPHIQLFEDKTMYDHLKHIYRTPQKLFDRVELVSPVTHERVRFSFRKVYSFYFESPFTPFAKINFRWLINCGFPFHYVLEDGRIYSVLTCDYLQPYVNMDGYLMYALHNANHKHTTMSMHRAVAIGFIPNPENKPEVNHIDGNKLNNHISNLEWTFSYENMEHALKHGLRKSVITDEQIHEVCKKLEYGDQVKSIMESMNLPKHVILGIKSGCHARISKNYDIPRNKHF